MSGLGTKTNPPLSSTCVGIKRGARDRPRRSSRAPRGRIRPQTCTMSSQLAPTGHLNRGIDGVFEIVRVVRRDLVFFAKAYAIIARAHLAQSEPEMACDRFGLLECHGSCIVEGLTTKIAGLGGRCGQDTLHSANSLCERDGVRAIGALIGAFRLLVALPPFRDLLLFAKDLFVAATVAIAPAGGSRMSDGTSSALNSEEDLASIPMAQGGLTRLAIAHLESAGVPVAPLLRLAGLTPEVVANLTSD